MPDDVIEKYRDDAHLETVLKKERVTLLTQLKKKYSEDNTC